MHSRRRGVGGQKGKGKVKQFSSNSMTVDRLSAYANGTCEFHYYVITLATVLTYIKESKSLQIEKPQKN